MGNPNKIIVFTPMLHSHIIMPHCEIALTFNLFCDFIHFFQFNKKIYIYTENMFRKRAFHCFFYKVILPILYHPAYTFFFQNSAACVARGLCNVSFFDCTIIESFIAKKRPLSNLAAK